MLQFEDLLVQVLLRKHLIKKPILKTRLIKLAYLVEVEYYRLFGERISNTKWIYYKYGPYVDGYNKMLKRKDFNYKSYRRGVYSKIGLRNPTGHEAIDPKMSQVIDIVVGKYGDLDLNELLDLVYFNTEPMIYVEDVNDVLDFSLVLPLKEYSEDSKLIPDKNLNSIKQFVLDRRDSVRRL